ncbi:MAG: hypothetical protein LKF96_01255 [Treponema sp.]|jgi:hypothetical protein|nr:hypothetical protein [Treponema sp.]
MIKNKVVCLSVLTAAFALVSCSRNKGISSIDTQELFKLSYGNLEKQLNLFDLSNSGQINTSLAMNDGFFYISNGEAGKILELNSYGDLLSLYYNKTKSVKPDFASSADVKNSTRKAVEYPFNLPGAISVDDGQNLYVADTLPRERQEQDKDQNLLLSQVVLRFSSDGKFIDYLGQQGPSGSPFPYIKNLYTVKGGELIVECVTNKGLVVYWFAANGYLLYTIPIDSNSVPNPYKDKAQNDMFISVDGVIPDYSDKMLYLMADYYTTTIDSASKVQSGIDYTGTMLYPLDIKTGTYGNPLSVPPYQDTETDGFSKLTYNIPYDFLGVTDSGWLFFIIATNDGFTIQMVQGNGQKILKRTIALDPDKLLYYTFSLSSNGILTGLFVRRDDARVDWWRTDSLIAELVKR